MRQADTTTLAPFYKGWDQYQRFLVEAIAPLTDEQLALRAALPLRPIWLLAAHIIGARVGWFHDVMGEGDATLAAYDPWDQNGAPPRTAAELVEGLEATWAMIQDCLDRWTPAALEDTISRTRTRSGRETRETFTRQWIIWHVIEHDLHHGGELFLTLGMHDLPTPDL
ncbi:MAG: hypothetical protein OJF49_004085 [Ktedonobacterales bacterium]|jgi:uncharacterized damage-inducible protein DinB|nr:MAG: hypothetical protein OJF49_004085 [Ktedonobacterales bacterium]